MTNPNGLRGFLAKLGSTLTLSLWGILLAIPAGAQDRAPVLLQQMMLLTPFEAAGTGLAPELQLRVTVDEKGKITNPEILKIQPSSDLDPLFEEALLENLARWRYAPALEDGKPVARELEWSVQFRPRGATSSSAWASRSTAYDFLDPEERLRRRLLGMSSENRAKHLNRLVEVAESALIPGRRQRYDSSRFVLVTDSDQPQVPQAAAKTLEATFSTLDRFFEGEIKPSPTPFKMIAFLYTRRDSVRTIKEEFGGNLQVDGFYAAPGFLTFHLEVPDVQALLALMLHEATHAYMDHHLFLEGTTIPRWLGEGFAEYIGNSEIKKGELIPGKIVESRFTLSHRLGVSRTATEAGSALRRFKQEVRKNGGLSLQELLRARRLTFSGSKIFLYYPTAWLFVHFLAHGEDHWQKERFPQFMLYMAEGYPAEEVLPSVYGMELAEIERRFQDYLKKI